MKPIFQMLVVIPSLAASVGQAQTVSVTNDGVVITWDKPEAKPPYVEPHEIMVCREIWPDAHFRCENRGDTKSWQCLGDRILWFSFAEDGIKLKKQKAQTK